MGANCFCIEENTDALNGMLLGIQGLLNVLMITGDLKVGVNKERSESYKKYLTSNKNIKIVDELIVLDEEDAVYKIAVEGLKNHPETDVVYLTNGFPIAVVKAIKDC